MSKFLNISTDNTLGGNSASDEVVSSQKAIKDYADGVAGSKTLTGLTDVTINNPTAGQNLTYDAQNQIWKNTSTSATIAWGGIIGTLSDQTDLKNALDGKQDEITSSNKLSASLVSGLSTVATTGAYSDLSGTPTIPTVNNATLTITQGGTTKGTFTANASSNVTIDLDSGGSADIDNLSITTNSSDELQAVGVINQNNTSTALKQWSGTKAQYDAIVTKDSNTLYNITDDTDVSLTILEAVYPVGSIYITTANTCPLASLISGSSWTNVGTSIITGVSIPSTIPVYGNGYGLTLTNNNQTFVMAHDGDHSSSSVGATNQAYVAVGTGTSRNGAQQALALGLPTASQIGSDLSKSGIIAKSDNITKTSLTVNIFQRTA